MSNYTGHYAHNDSAGRAPDADRLYHIADASGGYFTAAEAASAGYSRSLLSHHVESGMLERVEHGVYRLRRFPESPHADLLVAWLRAGEASAISHESALSLYGISDVLPTEVHLTIPRSSSRRRHGLALHTSNLPEEEVTQLEGVRVTTIERTIADVARAGLAEELVEQAIDEALQRGLTTPERLLAMADKRGGRAKNLVSEALAEYVPRASTRTVPEDIDRRALLRLPAAERRSIILAQALEFSEEYADSLDHEWLGADLGDQDVDE